MSQTAIVLYPYLKSQTDMRSPAAKLAEVVSLSQAIDLNVLYKETIPLSEIKAPTYIGKGAIDRIGERLKEEKTDVVILACPLSPLQQRNLEKVWQAKVIDKTALILEIFGRRARTKEGILQVELAHLTYARSRLVRSWTHLERQRGGGGFMGGPGETQIELDRRIIDEDIIKIKKELVEVKKTRALHRKARQKVPFPIVALVGYTNAGKSTLFNKLTRADVLAKDMLFATLDTTMRAVKLPSGRQIILSDTVGFISDLPTELVMAFRATLEEVLEADLILHVRDASSPDSLAQKKDVEKVLLDLGLKDKIEAGLTEVWNKIDLLCHEECKMIMNQKSRRKNEWPVSALTGQGIDGLLRHIDEKLAAGDVLLDLAIPVEDGAALAMAYRHGAILKRRDTSKNIILHIAVDPKDIGLFKAYGKKHARKKV
ncbi:MAG: GTPase HflX [Lactobacillales bacterium]|nr:GTPase HflX [Lactobacillales bacterium]